LPESWHRQLLRRRSDVASAWSSAGPGNHGCGRRPFKPIATVWKDRSD